MKPEKVAQPRYEPIEYDEDLDFSLQVAPSLHSLTLEQQASPGKPTPEQLEQQQQLEQLQQQQLKQQNQVYFESPVIINFCLGRGGKQ